MNLKSICLMLLAVFTIASCSNDDEPATQPQEAVTLEMTSGVIKNNSAAVKVVPSQNEAEYYIHLFTEEEYQTIQANLVQKMQEFAAADKAALVKGKRTRIYTDLQPAAKYVACALAVGEGTENEVKSVEFTTADEELQPLKITGCKLINDGDWYDNGTTEFRMFVHDATMSDLGWWKEGDVVQVFTLTDGTDDVPTAEYFEGLYSMVDDEEDKSAGVIMKNNTYMTHYGDNYSSSKSTHAEFAIMKEGEEYVVSGILKLENGAEYSIYYKGAYEYVQAGFYGYKSYEPQLDKDLVDLEYTLMKSAYYLDKKDGIARYSFACVHDPDPEISYGGVNKHCINMTLLAPVPKYPLLEFPEGTYTIQEGWKAFNAVPGDYHRYGTNEYGGWGSYYYYLDMTGVSSVQTDGFLRSGTIKVSRDGEDYIFDIDAQTNRGFKVSGHYRGTFTIKLDDFDNI